jgi:hypothetical protein
MLLVLGCVEVAVLEVGRFESVWAENSTDLVESGEAEADVGCGNVPGTPRGPLSCGLNLGDGISSVSPGV